MRLLIINATRWPSEVLRDSPGLEFMAVETDRLDEAESLLRGRSFDVVVLSQPSDCPDLKIAVERIQQVDVRLPMIVHSEQMSIEDAVRLTKLGSFCCLQTSDLRSPKLMAALKSAAEHRFSAALLASDGNVSEEPWRRYLIGESAAMKHVAGIVRLIASRRSTVLITGETGTGKEVVAKAIHAASNRKQRPMVSVNCGAIPEALIEAELFGHTKGAFTGATGSRVGRFEQANGSTLFLDEIGELPFDLQAKLLRVLQERELQRLGSSETVSLDVRIVAAANIDLLQAIADRKFRDDLYYRLNVVPVKLPSLRERAGDVALLVQHFLNKICQEEGVPPKLVSDETLNRLCEYQWPGNVRQLEHAIEMAVALSGNRDVLHPTDFQLPLPTVKYAYPFVEVPDQGICFDHVVGRLERSLLEQALEKTNGNKGRAADLLKLKRTTFLAKLKSFDLMPDTRRSTTHSNREDLQRDSYAFSSAATPVM